jgi:ribonuclease E
MNTKRAHLAGIEKRYGMVVTLLADPTLVSPEFRIERAKTQSRQIDVPEMVITAESVAASTSAGSVAAQPASGSEVQTPTERPDGARTEGAREERPDEKGEGRSRRRRGKRGGQRRRREDGESGASEQMSEPRAAAGPEPTSGAGVGRDDDATDDGKGSEKGRSRRRRGGRERSRGSDEDAVTQPSVGEAPKRGDAENIAIAAETGDVAPTVPDQPDFAAVDPANAHEYTDASELARVPETEIVAPETAGEAAAETAPEPEPVAAAPAELQVDTPPAPKRRGWWARG